MRTIADYFAMGGYAAFVWPAYGLTAIVMAGLVAQTLRRYRRVQRELAELERSRPAGARRRAS